MTTLDPNARALIEAGRRAFRSSAGDRERIEAALRVRLGDAALPPDAGIAQVTTTASWQTLTVTAIGICVLAGAAFYALGPAPRTAKHQARASTHRAASQTTTVSQPDTEPASMPQPALAAPASDPPSSASPRTRDVLALEVALLSRATTELRAGRAAEALEVLDDHQRRFPNGTLVEERRAARAQALCLLGRIDEGRAELARLTPRSPAAATAQRVCLSAKAAPADHR